MSKQEELQKEKTVVNAQKMSIDVSISAIET